MDSRNRLDWLQVIGAAGIILSLIFVGIELRQSHDIAVAAQYQDRYESFVETNRSYLQSEHALRYFGKRILARVQSAPYISDELKNWISEQPIEDLAILSIIAQSELKTADNLYYQYQSGFLSEEFWLSYRAGFKTAFALNPPQSLLRIISADQRESLRPSFRDFLDELAAEIGAQSK